MDPRSDGANILTSKWVFKTMDMASSSRETIGKNKVRQAARGFSKFTE